MDCLDDLEEFEGSIAKFLLPSSMRSEIIRRLDILGINYFSIFPDLVGLCNEIQRKEFT
jgi:hypothetical protein